MLPSLGRPQTWPSKILNIGACSACWRNCFLRLSQKPWPVLYGGIRSFITDRLRAEVSLAHQWRHQLGDCDNECLENSIVSTVKPEFSLMKCKAFLFLLFLVSFALPSRADQSNDSPATSTEWRDDEAN